MTPTAILRVCFFLLVTASSPGVVAQEVVYLSQAPELLINSRQDWGELGWDAAAHASGIQGQALRIGDTNYAHGLGHHANGVIQVLLSGEFAVFEGEVGIQPCAGGSV